MSEVEERSPVRRCEQCSALGALFFCVQCGARQVDFENDDTRPSPWPTDHEWDEFYKSCKAGASTSTARLALEIIRLQAVEAKYLALIGEPPRECLVCAGQPNAPLHQNCDLAVQLREPT